MLVAKFIYSKRRLSLVLLSLLGIGLLVSLTTPVSNLVVGLGFFGLLLFFLINFGYLILTLGGRRLHRRTKLRLVLICVFSVLALMFLSVKSLNWASGLTLGLLAVGMLFYSSRRS